MNQHRLHVYYVKLTFANHLYDSTLRVKKKGAAQDLDPDIQRERKVKQPFWYFYSLCYSNTYPKCDI